MSGSDCTDLDHCECVGSLYERIEELKAENGDLKAHVEYLMTKCHIFTDKRLKELLEQRAIDLQGHDDLSYIDKKLSEQEGELV